MDRALRELVWRRAEPPAARVQASAARQKAERMKISPGHRPSARSAIPFQWPSRGVEGTGP